MERDTSCPPVEPAVDPEAVEADSETPDDEGAEPYSDWDFTSIIPYTEDGVLMGDKGVKAARLALGWGPKPAVSGGDQ